MKPPEADLEIKKPLAKPSQRLMGETSPIAAVVQLFFVEESIFGEGSM